MAGKKGFFPTFRRIPLWGWPFVVTALMMPALIFHLISPTAGYGLIRSEYFMANMEKFAADGDPGAQYQLAKRYQHAQPPDFEKATYWYKKAAEQGHAEAQNNLGASYKGGNGVEKDVTQAIFWYEKSAQQGIPTAQANLAITYEYGQGVPVDMPRAIHWYEKAAASGEQRARFNLARLHTLDQVPVPDYAMALAIYNDAISRGDNKAFSFLAYHYYHGRGVPRDLIKAGELYQRSADTGDHGDRAFIARGVAGCTKPSLPQHASQFSTRTAVMCLTAAGARPPANHEVILYRASMIYRDGHAGAKITPDPRQALALYQRAIGMGYKPPLP